MSTLAKAQCTHTMGCVAMTNQSIIFLVTNKFKQDERQKTSR